ncbi:hypothetical protein [Xanthovirga aplysinae]|uniref:hypothetical protein n=1 Tax=Xanthovirga aplysinae TaxID=2529853 RepID=UPI0012BC622E|nr:hypothetical protein [Xanthovirga aplysinae]MTI29757.1 hypothetical protein [Xanthovirga aplysinae]
MMRYLFFLITTLTVLSYSSQAQTTPHPGDKKNENHNLKEESTAEEHLHILQNRVKRLKALSATSFLTSKGGYEGALGFRYSFTPVYAIEPTLQYSVVKRPFSTNLTQTLFRINNYFNLYRFQLLSINPYLSPMVVLIQNGSPIETDEKEELQMGAALGLEMESYITYKLAIAVGGGRRMLYKESSGFNFQTEGYLSLRFLFNAVPKKEARTILRYF